MGTKAITIDNDLNTLMTLLSVIVAGLVYLAARSPSCMTVSGSRVPDVVRKRTTRFAARWGRGHRLVEENGDHWDRNSLAFRCFEDFAEIAGEIERAEIARFLPHQTEMLPAKNTDLFINISSLHEMTVEQIRVNCKLINRLTNQVFDTMQWPANVQSSLFEAMYSIEPGSRSGSGS
jgi:hypothetical protein